MAVTSLFQASHRDAVAAMRGERLRMRAELTELMAGAQRTLVESRALLVEADAILAGEKLLLRKSLSPRC